MAYDCIEANDERLGIVKMIKASFYQYGCSDAKNVPNILIKSDDKREWYVFLKETICKQWNSAKKIEKLDDLTMLEASVRNEIIR